MRTNQRNLIDVARKHGTATASSWRAVSDGDTVSVWHYSAHLVDVVVVSESGGVSCYNVIPVNPGYGSTTDRCGIRKITGWGYRELFGC